MSWADFYKNRVNESYYNHVCTKYAPLIETVQMFMWVLEDRHSKDKPLFAVAADIVVVEAGCGLGNITKAVWKPSVQFQFHLVDKCNDMLNLARRHTSLSEVSNAHFYNNSISTHFNCNHLGRNCIAHSHGVLEHFKEGEIRQMIQTMGANSAAMVHYVPTAKYKTPSFGDERLWKPEKWDKLCKPDRIETFNDEYDLLLIWDKKL